MLVAPAAVAWAAAALAAQAVVPLRLSKTALARNALAARRAQRRRPGRPPGRQPPRSCGPWFSPSQRLVCNTGAGGVGVAKAVQLCRALSRHRPREAGTEPCPRCRDCEPHA